MARFIPAGWRCARRRMRGGSRSQVQPELALETNSFHSPLPLILWCFYWSTSLEMSGVSPGQRGLKSKTSELFRHGDRGSTASRLQKQDYHLVPPVPTLAAPDSNKPKRKLALWGKRRKSGSVSSSQSARPSGDSTNLLRKSGETSTGSPYRAVQNMLTRRVYPTCRRGPHLHVQCE